MTVLRLKDHLIRAPCVCLKMKLHYHVKKHHCTDSETTPALFLFHHLLSTALHLQATLPANTQQITTRNLS